MFTTTPTLFTSHYKFIVYLLFTSHGTIAYIRTDTYEITTDFILATGRGSEW